ncbi:MAG TPA: cupin domain-containing protein [Gemmatimonadaceae bacterium]|jgi:mannose-6-phosphate isomerase-like protein (cupin superfamily)
MLTPVNIESRFEDVTELWSPKVIGRVNDQYVKIARLQGEFVWHAHEGEDELFLVMRGSMRIQLEDGDVTLGPGEFVVVPRGVRHNPVAAEECWVMLIETVTTKHTGDVVTERTRSIEEQVGGLNG